MNSFCHRAITQRMLAGWSYHPQASEEETRRWSLCNIIFAHFSFCEVISLYLFLNIILFFPGHFFPLVYCETQSMGIDKFQLSLVQSLSHVQLFVTPWTAARPPCQSSTPGVYSNSCPLSQWCHPTISSSVIPLSSHLQSFPASGVFSNEAALRIRWPKYWSLSFSIGPSKD